MKSIICVLDETRRNKKQDIFWFEIELFIQMIPDWIFGFVRQLHFLVLFYVYFNTDLNSQLEYPINWKFNLCFSELLSIHVYSQKYFVIPVYFSTSNQNLIKCFIKRTTFVVFDPILRQELHFTTNQYSVEMTYPIFYIRCPHYTWKTISTRLKRDGMKHPVYFHSP